MSEKKLYLLDAFALIYRAHFAFARNPRFNSKGMNTSAVFGFTNSLLEILNNQKPTHIGVVFDTPGAGIREGMFAEYKANRDKMPEDIQLAIPYIKNLLNALNIPIVSLAGYEADDLMGTLAVKAEELGFTTYLMTPDKDFAQLVNSNTFIYKPARSGNPHQILGVKEVCEKFEIETPKQVIDILGLWGDAVDNIPGIPGIGEKTAKKLIGQYGSVEGLLQNTHELKGKQKENVETFADQGLLSKKLATIILDSPIEFEPAEFIIKEPNRPAVIDLLSELEFNRLSKRLLGEEIELKPTTNSGQMSLFGQTNQSPPKEEIIAQIEYKTISDLSPNYILISTKSEHQEFIELLNQQTTVCFDTETTGLNPREASIIGISFCFNKGEAYYCSIVENSELLKLYSAFFKNAAVLKIAHNLKFDAAILKSNGVNIVGPFFDTMIAHYLLKPDQRHGMDVLANNYLSYKPISIETLIGKKGKNQKSMLDVPAELIKDYAAEDADVTFQLYQIFEASIRVEKLEALFYDIEIPLTIVLMEMENEGISLDSQSLANFSVQLEISIKALKTTIYGLSEIDFNIDSPKQLGEVLFDHLSLDEKAKKTKTGQYKTDEQTLQKLANKHQIVKEILEYRQQKKLQSTYVNALPKLISTKTNRLHTTFMQTVAATGRLSSTNPNIQNIPIKTEMGKGIRRAFIPRNKDYSILAADYSQIELRIIAALSGDKGMIDAFKKNIDIHSSTASKVFGVALEEVTQDMRRKAKMVNFGIIYGITAFGLSQRLNIKRAEAKEIIDNYFEQFPDIKTYMDSMIDFARENGYVETIKKRKRHLKDINSRNAPIRGFAERNAINAPIQGSAADIIKIAMINIREEMQLKKLKSKLLLQVHDELVFDLFNAEKDVMLELVEKNMSEAVKLQVPLDVEIGIAANWLEAH
jgi:DNA polymerase-1